MLDSGVAAAEVGSHGRRRQGQRQTSSASVRISRSLTIWPIGSSRSSEFSLPTLPLPSRRYHRLHRRSTSDSATTSTLTVPYSLLYSISKWTRTEEGIAALSANSLNPRSYEMVSLLAGSTTSPERKFPPHKAETNDPLTDARREINDRKAVVTLINALLSIGGSGAATWYATGVAGWRNEWVRIHSSHSTCLLPADSTVESAASIVFPFLRLARCHRRRCSVCTMEFQTINVQEKPKPPPS
jgi:hypothetical protein